MTLAFSQKLNDKPTHFVEKIWETILQKGIEVNALEFSYLGRKALPKNYKVGTHNPKLHTIRKDEKDRWKAGNKIHFVINNRTADRFQFAPVVECKAIQYIEISYDEVLCEKFGSEPAIFVDGEYLNITQIEELAVNDGFKDSQEFCQYFDKDFLGKIIHWTDHIY